MKGLVRYELELSTLYSISNWMEGGRLSARLFKEDFRPLQIAGMSYAFNAWQVYESKWFGDDTLYEHYSKRKNCPIVRYEFDFIYVPQEIIRYEMDLNRNGDWLVDQHFLPKTLIYRDADFQRLADNGVGVQDILCGNIFGKWRMGRPFSDKGITIADIQLYYHCKNHIADNFIKYEVNSKI